MMTNATTRNPSEPQDRVSREQKENTMLRVKVYAALALPVLALLLNSAGTARASDNANGVTLYADNYQCLGASASGADLSQPVGFANFHFKGDQLTINVHLKGGQPNTFYYTYISPGSLSTCANYIATPSFTTNSNGVGNVAFSATVTPGASYYLTLWYIPFVYNTSGVETVAVSP
jgi:hypothetical protein